MDLLEYCSSSSEDGTAMESVLAAVDVAVRATNVEESN